ARRASVRDANELELLEALERFADDLAIDPEDFRQRPLRWETAPGRVALRHDLGRKLIEDLVGERPIVDGPEGHAKALASRTTPFRGALCRAHGEDTPRLRIRTGNLGRSGASIRP